jgi:hypothetical protein
MQRSHSVSSHFSCVGVEEEEAPDIDIYHCPNCEKTHGKSTRKYPSLGAASCWNGMHLPGVWGG